MVPPDCRSATVWLLFSCGGGGERVDVGGGGPLGGVADMNRAGGAILPDEVGDAVAARGGGGGTAGGASSDPAFLLTHRFCTGSYTKEVSSPRLARTGPGPGLLLSLRNSRPSQDDDVAVFKAGFSPPFAVASCTLLSVFSVGSVSLLSVSCMRVVSMDSLDFRFELPRPRSSASSSTLAMAVR